MSGRRDGFTLIEVLAALLIVGAATAAALAQEAEELRTARRAVSTVEASALAEDLLFRAEFLTWDSLTAGGRERAGRFAAPLDRYGWTLELAPSQRDSALMDATATITWNGGEYRLSTRFLQPPPGAP